MIRTHVTFVAEAFQPNNDESALQDGPSPAGGELARFIASSLAGRGIGVKPPDPIEEDYGHVIGVRSGRRRFWVHVGAYPSERSNWLVFVTSRLFVLWRLLGRDDTEDLARICMALDHLLKTTDGMKLIRWHHESDLVSGDEDHAAGSPGGVFPPT